MSNNPRYLTKSRFKLGRECPTKLYYTKKKDYADASMDDAFLQALADGGYQVGELAKAYFPGRHDITSLDYEEALKQTNELLKQEDVIIYEPAIRFNNLFIRVDILVKKGTNIEIIEVKAKSYSKDKDHFITKNGKGLMSGWKSYLEDIAFQYFVTYNAFPKWSFNSFLMLADKTSVTTTSGLNQKFKLIRDESNRKGVKVDSSLNDDDLKSKILVKVDVDETIQFILKDGSFAADIERLSKAYNEDHKIAPILKTKCSKCQFKATSEQEEDGLKSGFKECWAPKVDNDFSKATVLELWNSKRKDRFIKESKYLLSDLDISDIEPEPGDKDGLSTKDRQWLQVEKSQKNDQEPFFDHVGMKLQIESWKFPLHFIDFETSTVAIPFNEGRRPYEAIAFQFSHHTVNEEGELKHVGEFLNVTPGEFPNFNFVRALKKELENDNGSIFMYSAHENTTLNQIYIQLEHSEEADKEELKDFIRTMTKSKEGMIEKWQGNRAMVDMLELVKSYYYDPATKGSNSIKAVLPAILNSSDYLKKKYNAPTYNSNNFKGMTWLVEDGKGGVKDPYKLLPKLFDDISEKNYELISDQDEEIKNGGAALTAYARMQFTEMSDIERKKISEGLLRYCELDTLAMVMIYEAWREWCKDE